jgi:hypothetical protein
MPTGKPQSIEVVENAGGRRYIVATYADGKVVRKLINPNERPRRKPRKPFARAKTGHLDKEKKKQI